MFKNGLEAEQRPEFKTFTLGSETLGIHISFLFSSPNLTIL